MASRFSARPAFLPEPPSTRARALPSDDWERCGVCAHDLAATATVARSSRSADKGDSVATAEILAGVVVAFVVPFAAVLIMPDFGAGRFA